MQEAKTEIQLNAKPPCWVLSQLPLCYPSLQLHDLNPVFESLFASGRDDRRGPYSLDSWPDGIDGLSDRVNTGTDQGSTRNSGPDERVTGRAPEGRSIFHHRRYQSRG